MAAKTTKTESTKVDVAPITDVQVKLSMWKEGERACVHATGPTGLSLHAEADDFAQAREVVEGMVEDELDTMGVDGAVSYEVAQVEKRPAVT